MIDPWKIIRYEKKNAGEAGEGDQEEMLIGRVNLTSLYFSKPSPE